MLLVPQPPPGGRVLYETPKEGRRGNERINGGDGNTNEDEDDNVNNMNAVCPPPPPPPTLSLMHDAVVIGGISLSTYLSSGGDDNDNDVGTMTGMASFLGD
jgi:hypothetical protein